MKPKLALAQRAKFDYRSNYDPSMADDARLIILFDEAVPGDETSAINKLRGLRGAYRDDPDFDAAMRDIDESWQAWKP
ncbi:MAG: hypothetical protein ACRERV_08560 [Methylococcales bacterium]